MKTFIIFDGTQAITYTEDEITALPDFDERALTVIEGLEPGDGVEIVSIASGFILQVDRGPDMPEYHG